MKNKILSVILTAALPALAAPVPAVGDAAAKYNESITAINNQVLVTATHQALSRQVVYPALAVENGWEGTVHVRIWVSPKNRVYRVKVIRSSGYPVLDSAVVEAAYRTDFQVKGWTGFDVKFAFSLAD